MCIYPCMDVCKYIQQSGWFSWVKQLQQKLIQIFLAYKWQGQDEFYKNVPFSYFFFFFFFDFCQDVSKAFINPIHWIFIKSNI